MVQKFEVELGGWLEILLFDRSLLIFNGNINKNQRLPFEMLYSKTKFKNEEYRKESSQSLFGIMRILIEVKSEPNMFEIFPSPPPSPRWGEGNGGGDNLD
jgi:hypothetical protein